MATRTEPGEPHARALGTFKVLIAGAGVAGIETAVALSKRASGYVRLTLLAPDEQFHFRPGSALQHRLSR